MMPEKPWCHIHINHAINFMGSNWLIVTDAYPKYPCIHQTSSTSTKATTTMLLEKDFAHFGYPPTIVSDNGTTFSYAKLQEWCHYRGIKHHWNSISSSYQRGSGETCTILQTITKKLELPPSLALQEFLMQYRRTPLNTGFSPSQLLNGRQLRTKIDSLLPSLAHISQERQATDATKSQPKEQSIQFSTFVPDTRLEHHATICTVARDIPRIRDGARARESQLFGILYSCNIRHINTIY